MQNLYELLGVRPDDDAENVRKAFREAAKASHPDYHGGDPEAAERFSRIAQAYDILRDAAKRSAYDQLLEIQRRPLRAKLKRTISELKSHIVTDAIVGVIIASMLAGCYELFVRMSQTPTHEAGGITTGESIETAAILPGDQSDGAGHGRLGSARPAPQMPVLIPEMSGDESAADDRSSAFEAAKGEAVLDLAVQTIAVVKADSELDVPIDQATTKAGVDDPGKSQVSGPPDQQIAPSGEVPFSAPEKADGGQRLPSLGVAASDIKGDSRTPEPAGVTAADPKRADVPLSAPEKPEGGLNSSGVVASDIKGDSRTPEPAGVTAGDARRAAEVRGTVRPPAAARRRLPLQQASLESRNASACAGSQSCVGDRPRGDSPPPVFGVGF
jgi:curved DNA-binding protein CbpA